MTHKKDSGLSSIFEVALPPILIEAGNLILNYRTKLGNVDNKENNEIVTPADIASNKLINTMLKNMFPDIPIYSEENTENNDSETRWIVDPLDGTTPWVWGNSGFSVSLALEKNSQIFLGAVYDPVFRELFYAEKGKGAKRNGEFIQTEKGVNLKDMFLVVDWGNKDIKREEGLDYLRKFFIPEMFARRIVPQFSPALGLCRIAEGRTHALICNDTWVEDHSAGALILQEAGGYCTNFYNTTIFNHRESGIIAVNEIETHCKVVSFLKEKGIKINQ